MRYAAWRHATGTLQSTKGPCSHDVSSDAHKRRQAGAWRARGGISKLGFSLPGSGTAEPQLGDHGHSLSDHSSWPHRGWYSRGYLPHCDHPGLLQAITYRLADSLPAAVLSRLDAELSRLPLDRQDASRRRRIDTWLDSGHGSCALRIPDAAACVVDTWRHFDGERYDLIAWVVMPNHVHVLVRTYEGVALGKIVQSWKSYTGRRIGQMVRSRAEGGASRKGSQRVWMRGYWDRFIRDERHFHAVVDYIHQNPVKAGLVARAQDWPWSTVRDLPPG